MRLLQATVKARLSLIDLRCPTTGDAVRGGSRSKPNFFCGGRGNQKVAFSLLLAVNRSPIDVFYDGFNPGGTDVRRKIGPPQAVTQCGPRSGRVARISSGVCAGTSSAAAAAAAGADGPPAAAPGSGRPRLADGWVRFRGFGVECRSPDLTAIDRGTRDVRTRQPIGCRASECLVPHRRNSDSIRHSRARPGFSRHRRGGVVPGKCAAKQAEPGACEAPPWEGSA